jgi:hypothetical protein
VYGSSMPQIYKAEIILREAPPSIFEVYRNFDIIEKPQSQPLSQSQIHSRMNIAQEFNDEFKINLLSDENLIQFAENNNKINDFKNNLKEKNISVRNYFKGKFENVEDVSKQLSNKYSLTYSGSLPAETFLNEYIIFTKEKSLIIFKKTLLQKILAQIKLYQQNLKIAENIDLKNPILQSMIEGRGVINEPEALFYKGTKVLSQQLIFLNNLYNETQNLKLDYNPILESTLSEPLIRRSPIIFLFIGLVLGLFFSLIIIFVKKLLKS